MRNSKIIERSHFVLYARGMWGLAFALIALACSAIAQTKAPTPLITAERTAAVARIDSRVRIGKETALRMAKAKGWSIRGFNPQGKFHELQGVDRNGRPIYYTTSNIDAAISAGTNLIRNTNPYNVSGSGFSVGIWDEGSVRSTHQEFGGRVTIMDGSQTFSDHPTHVAGTIGAAGVGAPSGVPNGALGMAPSVSIESYDWNNDLAEVAAASLLVSNHSYGRVAGWDIGRDPDTQTPRLVYYGVYPEPEDRTFGQYSDIAALWDEVCYLSPYTLPFRAAGNDRDDMAPSSGATFWYLNTQGYWISKSYTPAEDPYNDGWDGGGFDTVGDGACSKNVLTVGAADDAVATGVRSVAAGTMSEFSGWGPTDDGRIKPDLVANGVRLISPLAFSQNPSVNPPTPSDTDYGVKSGTSMATPSAAGSAILLQELAQATMGRVLRADALKGLLIHTADDDVEHPGPDYRRGWGYLNVKAAADHIRSLDSATILEGRLTAASPAKTFKFRWSGNSPIKATLCWTDPPAPGRTELDDRSKVLVNDLDLRIAKDGVTHHPWILNVFTPNANATKGDNTTDNVEQVQITSPSSGIYELTVSCKGALARGAQNFALIISEPLIPVGTRAVMWGNIIGDELPMPENLSGVTTIAAGWNHVLALMDDGTVVAWGDNDAGQCEVPNGLSGVVAIAAGVRHSVALKYNGTVVSWGYSGLAATSAPLGLSGVAGIAAGANATVALKIDGTVVAWAPGSVFGQTSVPENVNGVASISAGSGQYSLTLALKGNGTVQAWGYNGQGQSTVPENLSGVVDIDAGPEHSLALKSNGTVVTWGNNESGQCSVPAGLNGIIDIAGGRWHSAALKNDGTIVSWGLIPYGMPAGLKGVTAIDAGRAFTVALYTPSSDADLAAIALSSGALNPIFSSEILNYTVNVSNETTSITVTPTTHDSNATIMVNGSAVQTAFPTEPITLNVGSNTIVAVVTAQDEIATKTYSLTVIRAASSNADLASLVPSTGGLEPVFAAGTTDYTMSVPNSIAFLTLTPTVAESNAMVTVNGSAVASGSPSEGIYLNVGENTITTIVTAQDMATEKTYTLIVNRAPSSNADLANMVLSTGPLTPLFSSAVIDYTTTVPNAVTSFTITPTVADATAVVRVNGMTVASGNPSGAIPLEAGQNTITTEVTAQDWTTKKNYRVVVTREAPEIVVEGPSGNDLVDGAAVVTFGTATVSLGTTSRIFTVRNSGNVDLTGLDISFTGDDVADFSVTTAPSTPVQGPQGTTSFVVRFAPGSAGTKNAVLHIGSNDVDENPFDIFLTATALTPGPEIVVEQPAGNSLVDQSATIDFGGTPIPSGKVSRTFKIRNAGTANLTGVGINLSGEDAADFEITAHPNAQVAPEGSTTFTVSFTPGTIGAKSALLHIASNDADEDPFDVTLIGNGHPPAPEIVVEHPAGHVLTDQMFNLGFGSVLVPSGQATKTFTVKNIGSADLAGLEIDFTGQNPTDFSVAAYPASSIAAPNGSTTFQIRFAPGGVGTRSAVMHLTSNDQDEGSFEINLSGKASWAAPEIVVEHVPGISLNTGDYTVAFGPATPLSGIVTKSFTIRNTGSADLTGLGISFIGDAAADFSVATNPVAPVNGPNGRASFIVRFTPSGDGVRTAVLQITNNDEDENPFSITLTGTGVPLQSDAFVDRIDLGDAAIVDIIGDTTGASLEPAEETFGGRLGASTWYEWTAPATGWVTIHTVGSVSDTVLGLFTGSTISSLEALGFNDMSTREADFEHSFDVSRLVFHAQAGVSYKICVGGFKAGDLLRTGAYQLHIAPEPEPPFLLQAVTMAPRPADVSADGVDITLRMTVGSNELLSEGQVFYVNIRGWDGSYAAFSSFEDQDRVEETALSETYERSLRIPPFLSPGDYTIEAGNYFLGGPIYWTSPGNDLVEDHYLLRSSDGLLPVINSGAVDRDYPVPVSITGFPTIVDVSQNEVTFSVDITVTDALAGFDSGSLLATSSSAGNWTGFTSFFDSDRIAGDRNQGTYRVLVTIPQGMANGFYHIGLYLQDLLGNGKQYSNDLGEIDSARFPPTMDSLIFEVVGGSDFPGLTVTLPPEIDLISGVSTVDFGSVIPGEVVNQILTIRNSGTALLDGIQVSMEGGNSSGFSYEEPATNSLNPGAEASFQISLRAISSGPSQAKVIVSSNVVGSRGFFTIPLRATVPVLSALDLWRYEHFGNPSNSGNGADTASPLGDGVNNLMKFATAMDPKVFGAMPGTMIEEEDRLLFSYVRSKIALADGITLSVEWSDILGGDWSTDGVTEMVVDQGDTEFVTTAIPKGSEGQRFIRLRVRKP